MTASMRSGISAARGKRIEEASVGNLKQTWIGHDWDGEGREFLAHATQVKNVWIPYGA